jgi:hypothetical protein
VTLRTGSLTAQLAARLPAPASRENRCRLPLITVLKYAHLLVLVRQRLELTFYVKDQVNNTIFNSSIPHFAGLCNRKGLFEIYLDPTGKCI